MLLMSDETLSPPAEYEDAYPYAPRSVAPNFEKEPELPAIFRYPLVEQPWLEKLPYAIALFGLMLACDFAIVPLMNVFNQSDWGALWVYACFGAILAQGGWLSAIAVFLRCNFWLRMAAFWAAVLLSWTSWALGIAFDTYVVEQYANFHAFDSLRLVAFMLPLIAIAIQMPLWSLRLYRGWELLRPSHLGQPAEPVKILDYLVCTGMVAVAITSARLAVKPTDVDGDYWAGCGIACSAAAGISLISVPPAMWLLLRWRNAWLGWVTLISYGAIATVITLIAIHYANLLIWERPSGMPLWAAIGMTTVFVSCGTLLGAGLFSLRALGLSFATRRMEIASR